jgi:hypothetical protein
VDASSGACRPGAAIRQWSQIGVSLKILPRQHTLIAACHNWPNSCCMSRLFITVRINCIHSKQALEKDVLTDGDSLFKDSQDSSTAKITWLQSTFLSYVDAYHFATVSLLDHALHDPGSYENTFKTVPIISLIRHSIELMLKTILYRADEVLGTDDMKDHLHHNIENLWQETQSSLEKIGIVVDKGQAGIATNIISKLCQHDPLSFAFRYPFDKTMSKSSLAGVGDINLTSAKDVYLRLREFLMNLVVEVYHLPDASDSI